MGHIWGHRFVTDSVLKTAVSEVRAALDDDPKQPRHIETVSRRGYRFITDTASPSLHSAPANERNAAAGCDDAALAALIRAVAAGLESERRALGDS